MSDYLKVSKMLKGDPAKLAEFTARVKELAQAYRLPDARQQAADEYRAAAVEIISRPKPEPEPIPEPPAAVTDLPDIPPEQPPGQREKIDLKADVEFVYRTYALQGKSLEKAKAAAPSGGALTLLKKVQEDPAFNKLFFSTMIPRYVTSQEKFDEGARKRGSSKPILTLIEQTIINARTAAGVGQIPDEEVDAESDAGLEPIGSEGPA